MRFCAWSGYVNKKVHALQHSKCDERSFYIYQSLPMDVVKCKVGMSIYGKEDKPENTCIEAKAFATTQ
jgi:hypothetical protein